jgi:hypothetical protein
LLIQLAVLAAALQLGSAAAACISTTGPWRADAEAVAVLRKAPPGRLLTTFDWGQYAIWHLGPAIKVSLDGRRETVYSNDHLMLHNEVIAGTSAGLEALDRWRPDYVWLPRTAEALRQPLEARGYRVALETAHSWLASRAQLEVRSPSSGASPCFPD